MAFPVRCFNCNRTNPIPNIAPVTVDRFLTRIVGQSRQSVGLLPTDAACEDCNDCLREILYQFQLASNCKTNLEVALNRMEVDNHLARTTASGEFINHWSNIKQLFRLLADNNSTNKLYQFFIEESIKAEEVIAQVRVAAQL